eukprot:1441492-Amphidinium_carterae.1
MEVARALGDESLDDLVLMQLKTSSPLGTVCLSLVYNTARANFVTEFVDVGSAVSPVVPASQQLVNGGKTSSITGLAKVKMATVAAEAAAEIRHLDGRLCDGVGEVTDGQLSAFALERGGHVLVGGEWKMMEQYWRVYRTAAIMCEVAKGLLNGRRSTRVHGIWRVEWWPSERREQEAFHQCSPSLSVFVPAMPWKSVLKAAASSQEYWSRELTEPALSGRCLRGRRRSRSGVPQLVEGVAKRQRAGDCKRVGRGGRELPGAAACRLQKEWCLGRTQKKMGNMPVPASMKFQTKVIKT